MAKSEMISVKVPDLNYMNQVATRMFGKASLRIILRKVSVALKPKYAPLVRLAKAAYQSGYGRRSGATAAAFGQKAWSAKSGSPRSAVVVGLNNKAGLKRFAVWQQRMRNRYEEVMGKRLVHPVPERLTNPEYHKPSKILHFIDGKVGAHMVDAKNRKTLAAPEKGKGAFFGKAMNMPSHSGKKIMPRIRKKGIRLMQRYGGREFEAAFEAEVMKKYKAAMKKQVSI